MSWMPQIEQVLASSGTSPTDFTLHDSQHAWRVAQRMAEIMPATTLTGLGPYDLAFLLLSAYLHDIGMTPEQRKVSLHYQYLLNAVQGHLTNDEVQEFQRWLDDDENGLTPPLCSGPPSSEELCQANRLVAHYCRHQHNEWSAEWIRKNAPTTNENNYVSLGTFEDWVDDLIRLCRSHRFGKSELQSEAFNPRLVGHPGQVLHLRYLACVLRVADVLEFDPERTPRVILSHREVDRASLIYWYKDHGISPKLETDRFIVAARPESARLYRAVEEMLEEIDAELALCRTLADETHFENCPGLTEKQPHCWHLSATVHRDLKPKPDTFVYINSSFRPNTQRILQLLSGIELYGNPLAAVRELLQNAFDAVREQIAHARLLRSDPADRTLDKSMGERHRVELRLEQRNDDHWLVCSDNGVGMNKRIIEHHLLVSGQSRRHDIASLERRCQNAGFTTGRTGQFGIGVLSYFMIADRLRLSTQRSLEPGDADATGWKFDTEGVGSWGELRSESGLNAGTRVELHLKQELFDDAASWYADLRKYLAMALTIVPCEFHINSNVAGCEPLALDPGWTASEFDLASIALNKLHLEEYGKATPLHLLPSDARARVTERDRRWEELRDKASACLGWLTQEGDLPDGLGKYRVHIPYFDLPGGASLAFMDVEERKEGFYLGRIGEGCAYRPPRSVRFSWKGIRVELALPHRQIFTSGTLVQIDFHANAAGKPEVNRSRVIPNRQALDCIDWVGDQTRDLLRQFVVDHATSSYSTLNARYAKLEDLEIAKPQWIVRRNPNPEHIAIWGPVHLPTIDNISWRYQSLPKKVTWKGKSVNVLPCVGGPSDADHYDGLSWSDLDFMHPDRIVHVSHWRDSIGFVWEKNPWRTSRSQGTDLGTSKFPPAWKHVVGVSIEHCPPVWNAAHRIVPMVTAEAWDWIRTAKQRDSDPVALQDDLLSDRARAAAWLLQTLHDGDANVWRSLIEREPSFLRDLWTMVFGSRTSRLPTTLTYYVYEAGGRIRLRVVDPNVWHTYRHSCDQSEIDHWMPDPGPDWTVKTEDKMLGVGSRLRE